MSKDTKIEGASPKRYRLFNRDHPEMNGSFDTAEETLNEYGDQQKRHDDLDERGILPRPKITIIDGNTGKEILIEKLRQLAREEIERRERGDNEDDDAAE